LLHDDLERLVCGTILGKAAELGITVHQIGNTDDHLHLVASIPPKLAVAESVRHLKGASSHYANVQQDWHFTWQEGYGVISIGERSLATVIAYVAQQRQHHAEKSTWASFEEAGEDAAHRR
jgi:putative transposase